MDRKQWRDQVIEAAIEPELPIVDAHHHLWATAPAEPWEAYDADSLMADMADAGHNIVATVYTDSHANYRTEGPAAFRVVGETEFAEQVANAGVRRGGSAAGICAAIVSHANLLLGEAVGEVLDAHIAASSRFRGIRYMTAFDPELPPVYGATEPDIMTRPEFRRGFAELVRRDLSFDAWMFQAQMPELVDLIRAFPDARIVLDHVGGPLAVGRYAGRRDEAFAEWKTNIAAIAQHPNVTVKIGALNMTVTGMDAVEKDRPDTSEETARLQRDHILTTIDLFGPDRCMFESNFPVDMRSISYTLVWNVFKRVTQDFSAADRASLFAGTAKRAYRIEGVAAL